MPASISRRELVRKFRTFGFEGPFSGGKHQFMVKAERKVRIPNPHGDREIHVSLVNEILRQAGISPREWDEA
jgi:predicted RNA binding protein YcfA (HicA-like mRNA interferase family)